MKLEMNQISQYIDEAEFILVGCGKELIDGVKNDLEIEIYKQLEKYNIFNQSDLINYIKNEKYAQWLRDILIKSYNKTIPKENNIYQKLFNLVKDKKYFIVTTNTDERIYQSDFDLDKIVAPCGNEGLFQCKQNCTQEIWRNNQYIESVISNLEEILNNLRNGNDKIIEQYHPMCKNCHEEAIYNVREDKLQYNEQGYLKQWQVYIDWLQRTLNRNIVMIELGEDFKQPTVIRWPFEKNTFINEKAVLIRVNETFPQISEEIKDRAFAIKMNAAVFLKEFDKK